VHCATLYTKIDRHSLNQNICELLTTIRGEELGVNGAESAQEPMSSGLAQEGGSTVSVVSSEVNP
jgi:hypothetical protein